MRFRVFMHDSMHDFKTYAAAAAYVQGCVYALQLASEPVRRWWAQIDRLSDGCYRLVWFDAGGVYHCSPWLSD